MGLMQLAFPSVSQIKELIYKQDHNGCIIVDHNGKFVVYIASFALSLFADLTRYKNVFCRQMQGLVHFNKKVLYYRERNKSVTGKAI